jgi:hypothetical protein
MATTKLVTKATLILVTTDDNGKETRQQFRTAQYEYKDFDRTQLDVFLALAAATMNH